MLADAQKRIEEHRTGPVTVRVTDAAARGVPGRALQLTQRSSGFLFGCNIFRLNSADDGPEQRLYQTRFTDLLNYATLPFYWGGYERQPGQTREKRLMSMAAWCAERGIRTKGHPLVWHEVYPAWADDQPEPVRQLLERRVRHIASAFAGLVDVWDVINESTVAARFENGVGEWVREEGPVRVAAECLRWTREAGPNATLVLNEYNLSPEFEAQIEALLNADCKPDVIGLQSHMHAGEWPMERVWQACETYARFGLPLHFTEVSVLSGDYLPDGEEAGRYRPAEWPSTPEGEERQAAYVEQFYTTLFSHPAVEAITWWDLPDGSWMNAPSGLVRRDLSPKPAYERLLDLVTRQWRTDLRLETGADGKASARAFHGTYSLTDLDTGRSVEFEHTPAAPGAVDLRLV